MNFMNSTISAAATLLPYAVPQFHSSGTVELTPVNLNIDPWSIFDKAWTTLVGYPAQDFRFEEGSTPISTTKAVLSWIATYYVVIFGGRALMANRPAFKLHTAFIIHNFYLTAISGALLVLFLQQIVPSIWNNGLYDNVCGVSGWTKPLVVLYYLNYLTKYLELLDTVFLVLKKKPLTLLHTYHHGATALLCYTQLVGQTSVSWVPITLNLTVHVVMYWYYYQSARGVRVWWKQYITMLQISQFVLDLGFIYFACYNYAVSTYAPSLPHVGTCGDPKQELAAATGCAIISSYLFLFIGFYLSTYKKPAAAKKALKKASKTQVPTLEEASEKTVDALRTAGTTVVETLRDEKCSISI
ncbi:Fatty acyl-CoA elongase/Polyunsaturated fatty acid specific elongation enzyme [Lithohypha guttulata]|uniref:Elongation of fatty acids protein n=1 Tax=Lithohypha guttulata TaxID=1690604 RepID=A0AAN7YD01_9EURO|nr:Fatty acyl-CoA elongase/Polyunsaturated fatty acid specific elongation enzyme [Lithohypha guttulata]